MRSVYSAIMQNARSKSITPRAVEGRPHPEAGGASQMPPVADGPVPPATQLRLVPGRIALFAVILFAVAMMLVPRLVAVASTPPQAQVHVVEKGETLWGVAGENAPGRDRRDFVDQLRRINRLSTPQIFPGQPLILP